MHRVLKKIEISWKSLITKQIFLYSLKILVAFLKKIVTIYFNVIAPIFLFCKKT